MVSYKQPKTLISSKGKKLKLFLLYLNSLQCIITSMITWPHVCTIRVIIYKGGQVTKLIIVVKMPCELLHIIQVKESLIKSF